MTTNTKHSDFIELAESTFGNTIKKAATENGVDADLVTQVIAIEFYGFSIHNPVTEWKLDDDEYKQTDTEYVIYGGVAGRHDEIENHPEMDDDVDPDELSAAKDAVCLAHELFAEDNNVGHPTQYCLIVPKATIV